MKLPRYVVARARSNETVYYWQVPVRQRRPNEDGELWPTGLVRLPPGDMQAQARILNDRIEALEVEVERLKSGGCARGQRTTQWCAEASDAMTKVRAAEARAERLRVALERIADHWANQYYHPNKSGPMYDGPYGIGVTDGHRACTTIARKALEDDKQ